MAEQQVDGPPNKKQKVYTPSTPTDSEVDSYLNDLPHELCETRNRETDDSNSKPQELQQLLGSDTPSSNLSSNKIHATANPVAIFA